MEWIILVVCSLLLLSFILPSHPFNFPSPSYINNILESYNVCLLYYIIIILYHWKKPKRRIENWRFIVIVVIVVVVKNRKNFLFFIFFHFMTPILCPGLFMIIIDIIGWLVVIFSIYLRFIPVFLFFFFLIEFFFFFFIQEIFIQWKKNRRIICNYI